MRLIVHVLVYKVKIILGCFHLNIILIFCPFNQDKTITEMLTLQAATIKNSYFTAGEKGTYYIY